MDHYLDGLRRKADHYHADPIVGPAARRELAAYCAAEKAERHDATADDRFEAGRLADLPCSDWTDDHWRGYRASERDTERENSSFIEFSGATAARAAVKASLGVTTNDWREYDDRTTWAASGDTDVDYRAGYECGLLVHARPSDRMARPMRFWTDDHWRGYRAAVTGAA